jgi:outer membrane protein assembly factor BamB
MLVAALDFACSPAPGIASCKTLKRNLTETSDFKLLWSNANVFVVYGSNLDPSLYGLNATVFAKIRGSNNFASQLIALDTQSGRMKWQKDITSQGTIIASDSTLYIGDYDHIQEYDPQTGNLIRVTDFRNIGNIYNMFVNNHSLYALSSSGTWLTFNLEDQTSELSEPFLPYTPFVVDNGVLYSHDANGFHATKNETGETLWIQPIDEAINLHPLFIDNIVIILSETGNIYGLDKENGNLIWKKETNIISNIAADTSQLYFLTKDGYLEVLNISSGQEIYKFGISLTGFNNNLADSTVAVGVYNIWMDSQNNIAIFSLGDSCQLIGFKLNDG